MASGDARQDEFEGERQRQRRVRGCEDTRMVGAPKGKAEMRGLFPTGRRRRRLCGETVWTAPRKRKQKQKSERKQKRKQQPDQPGPGDGGPCDT